MLIVLSVPKDVTAGVAVVVVVVVVVVVAVVVALVVVVVVVVVALVLFSVVNILLGFWISSDVGIKTLLSFVVYSM